MAFFSSQERRLARDCSKRSLTREYRKTEKALQKAARRGASDARMQAIMDKHHTYEYALLAQQRMKANKKI